MIPKTMEELQEFIINNILEQNDYNINFISMQLSIDYQRTYQILIVRKSIPKELIIPMLAMINKAIVILDIVGGDD